MEPSTTTSSASPAGVTTMKVHGIILASAFNQPLSDWRVDNVTDMRGMFQNAWAFNQPLNNWRVDKVTNMSAMFRGASSFNQPLGDWRVAQRHVYVLDVPPRQGVQPAAERLAGRQGHAYGWDVQRRLGVQPAAGPVAGRRRRRAGCSGKPGRSTNSMGLHHGGGRV